MTRSFVLALASLGLAAGCTYRPSFDERASYATVQAAAALDASARGPLAIRWIPESFPDRVDEIGPVGSEGAASSARIPTGAGVAGRTGELLDAAVGVSASSDLVLTIEVREAAVEYRYATGWVGDRHIDAAQCTLDVELRCGDRTWEERLVARATKVERGEGGTALLDAVWDDVSLRLTKSVVARLPDRPASAPPPAAPPAARTGTSAPTTAEEIEALRRILLRRGLITETEWEEAIAEVVRSRRRKLGPTGTRR
jgi:hypothetical protein